MPRHRRRTHYHRRSTTPWGWLAWLALLAILLLAYFRGGIRNLPPGTKPPATRNVSLLETSQNPVLAGVEGWDYQRTLQADLDSDGTAESVEVIARVAQVPGRPGEYQWDDGQPWQVYVLDNQKATYVYRRFVQLGRLDVFITDEPRPRIGIAEVQGAGYSLYTVTYQGPGKFGAAEMAALSVKDRTW